MSWLKWHIGCVSDDKWPLIARRSGQNVGTVVAVWAALLECASEADEPGSIAEFDPDSIDALYGYEDGTCESIIQALKDGKNPRVVDNTIVKFGERQKRVDETHAERQKRYRDRQKENKSNTVTDGDAKVTEESVTRDGENVTVTENNAKVTGLDKNREEKKRNINTQTPSLRSGVSSEPSSTPPEDKPPPSPPLDAVICLPLNTGEEHPVTQGEVEQWRDLYPAVDVLQALRNMRGWCLGQPKRRKTKNGVNKFIHTWLAGEQNKGGGARASPAGFQRPSQADVIEQNAAISRKILEEKYGHA
jgi:hypothetical protein